MHADRRFALFAPPPDDPNHERVRDALMSTVERAAMRLRAKCASEYGISIWDVEVVLTPDQDKPNFITLTAYPRAILDTRMLNASQP